MNPGPVVDLEIPLQAWSDVRGDGCLLKAVLWINRTPFHLEAVQVRPDDDGILDAVAPEDRERLDALEGMHSARWVTMPLALAGDSPPREYVAYVVPFGG